MADLHHACDTFHDRIFLTSVRRAALRAARDAIRQRIRNYFRDALNVLIPKFRGQGSYAMGTTVNPIDGEYDIDDGIYLQHLDTRDDKNWPAAGTAHQWLMKATDGHAGEKSMDKHTCVRVRYAGQYHVDLPAYGELNGKFMLAVKGAHRWPHSDPLAITAWFRSYVNLHGEQLRRVVRYLKAWADFQSTRRGEMPSGLILTVLAANHFQGDTRDDLALERTLNSISHAISSIVLVLNPVDIAEELSARLTVTQKTRFQEAVHIAAAYAHEAVTMEDNHKASELWRKQLGDRFPLVEKKGNHAIQK